MSGALKIFVALEPQDLRKSFQGLTELALGHLGERLTREALFVFVKKRRTRIKLLYFDGTGLVGRHEAARGGQVQLAAAQRAEPEEAEVAFRSLATACGRSGPARCPVQAVVREEPEA